ncbi:hypothetical protein HYU96_03925 [Candidatus Daviesbacteria bacterium]|nr:hypothetical protein [Candidatus Daviesbacteria bacterium]
MPYLLGLVLASFVITSIFMVPFIDLLFFLKRKLKRQISRKSSSQTPIHDQLMKDDEKIPSGAGALLIVILVVLSIVAAPLTNSLKILLFTLVSFGVLGFVDDFKLMLTRRKGKFFGLDRGKILIWQSVMAILIATMLYVMIGMNNLYIAYLGNFVIGYWYIPLAAFVIVSFANAYNISDGLDGLAAGLLLICLFAFLGIASISLDLSLASFIGIWIGALFAFLYFNIWPARIFLGDSGAFAFGATLAVVGLLTGKILALAIIGGMFVVIVASSLLQIMAKVINKKILPVTPIHMYFRYIGWEEPKIVVRFWLAQGLLAIFGLWIALLSR